MQNINIKLINLFINKYKIAITIKNSINNFLLLVYDNKEI